MHTSAIITNSLKGLLVWAVFAAPAWAVLGQASTLATSPTTSPPAVNRAFNMTAETLASGVLVKEFFGPDGVVFAVSWRGPVQPDLATLLGPYLATFKEAHEAARVAGRRGAPLSMAKDGLVVQASGRTPHFFGYAYVTHLVPSGINIKDVVQ